MASQNQNRSGQDMSGDVRSRTNKVRSDQVKPRSVVVKLCQLRSSSGQNRSCYHKVKSDQVRLGKVKIRSYQFRTSQGLVRLC